jgi:hypothetical protein
MRRSGPTRHVAQVDPELTDPRTGVEYCADAPVGCGLPIGHPIHNMPEREQDERAHEQRRIGER